MCNDQFSESGYRIGNDPCAEYLALKSDRDRLAGVVAGMEDQGQRNLDAMRRAEAENDSLRFRADTNRTGLMVLDQRVESLESENARLREALKLVSAVVEGTESVPSAMGVAEYIVCLIGNALKEVG